MKQLFLIMLIAGTAFTASAQRDYRNDGPTNKYHYKYDRYDRTRMQNNRNDYQRQVAMINRDYDTRIDYIRNHPNMRRREKNREIRELQAQRNIALNQCREKFSHREYAGDRRKW